MSKTTIEKTNIFSLYDLYSTYKFYYNFYWDYQKNNITCAKTKEEVQEKIDYILKNKKTPGSAFDYLCWFAGINPYDVKEKDMNGVDVLLEIIKESEK